MREKTISFDWIIYAPIRCWAHLIILGIQRPQPHQFIVPLNSVGQNGAEKAPDAAAILWNVQCFELWYLLRGVAEPRKIHVQHPLVIKHGWEILYEWRD